MGGFTGGMTLGFALGLPFGLPYGLLFGVETVHADPATASSPRAVLARDAAAFRVTAATAVLLFGLAGWLAAGLYGGTASGAAAGLAAALVYGIPFGLIAGFGTTQYAAFTVCRAWLAARGRLPWSLMAFLDDAHRRGVLRQAEGAA